MVSMEYFLVLGWGCLQDCIFVEAVEWDEENQVSVSLWETGANSESYSKHFEARPFQLFPLRDISFSQAGSSKWNIHQDQTHLLSIPVYKKIGNSDCIYTKGYSHFCISGVIHKGQSCRDMWTNIYWAPSIFCARPLTHPLKSSPHHYHPPAGQQPCVGNITIVSL